MTYTKEQGKQKIKELVERFRYNLDVYKKSTYNETQVRREFIDPFFEALGWDVSNKQGYAEQYKDVVHEDAIKVGHSTRAPDYSFRIGGQRKFFVEAKKPAVNIKEDVHPSYQLRRYAWSAKLPLSIVTDFEEFSVFNCQMKPNPTDKPGLGRFAYYTFDVYIDKFDEIYDVFSKEAVLKGSFDRYAQSTKGKKGTATVDSEFLKEIESWRELLAKNIALRNPNVSIYELNYSVQKIIDRIIFLRICEDRGIEHYGQLQTKAEGGDVYMHLLNHFKLAESKYDSGIFDFDSDMITGTLTIDDKVLKTIIQDLYYPKSPYEFSVLGVEILGNVYEQFLGKVIRLTAGHQAKVETKPEVKKAGGVYYTPQYIVEYIVENTVGNLIAGKTPEEIAEIKVLDPACGSGSFLIGAYTYLLRYHLDWYVNNKPKKHKEAVFQAKENEWYLTTTEKKRILLDNIFGVDIDSQAVEVTKMSLLLKVLEHESRESIDQQMKLGLEGVLPNLGDNIKCGNSLIGPEYYDLGQQGTLFDEEEMRRVNVFDWDDERKGFGGIMQRGGFDCVVGNPPYVRIQVLKEWMPAEVGFYKQYKTGRSNNYDIYVIFVEKGLSLLNEKGLLGFILPNKFMHQEYGKNLRLIISDNKNLMKLLNFKDFQVFEGATTYTCLLFLSKEPREYNLIGLYKNTGRTIADSLSKVVFEKNSNSKIDSKPWNFCDIEEQKIMDKLQNYPPLNTIADNIFVGLQTSADKIYHLEQIGEKEHHYMVQSKSTGDKVELEKTILKPLISGVDVKRYTTPEIKTQIIFPYTIQSGKFTLIHEKTLKKELPLLHQYLLEYKKILGNREKGKFKGSEWYRFGRNQNIDKQHFKKICVPRLVKRIQAILDLSGTYYLDNVDVGGLTLKDDSDNNYKYILALLNSKLLSFYLTRISTPFRGGFYSCNKQYLSKLPIRTINFSNPAEKAQHDKLVALVESMLELQKKHHETRMEQDKELYERQIKLVDAQIDRLVYDSYGLTEEEVNVVEGE